MYTRMYAWNNEQIVFLEEEERADANLVLTLCSGTR